MLILVLNISTNWRLIEACTKEWKVFHFFKIYRESLKGKLNKLNAYVGYVNKYHISNVGIYEYAMSHLLES